MAIIKDGTNQQIEYYKAVLGIKGDVYIDKDNHIASLDSHKTLLAMYDYPSIAETIEKAEVERAAFEAELERRRKEAEKQLTLEDALEILSELGVNTDDQ